MTPAEARRAIVERIAIVAFGTAAAFALALAQAWLVRA